MGEFLGLVAGECRADEGEGERRRVRLEVGLGPGEWLRLMGSLGEEVVVVVGVVWWCWWAWRERMCGRDLDFSRLFRMCDGSGLMEVLWSPEEVWLWAGLSLVLPCKSSSSMEVGEGLLELTTSGDTPAIQDNYVCNLIKTATAIVEGLGRSTIEGTLISRVILT